MNKRGCTLQISNNNKSKFVLEMTLSGIIILSLELIVGIVLYHKKKNWERQRGCSEPNEYDGKETKTFVGPWLLDDYRAKFNKVSCLHSG
jgi:hypothetical protein